MLNHPTEYWILIIGWVGACLFLVAYVLLSRGWLAAHSRVYQGLNIAGAAGLAVSNGAHGALPSATLNLIWIARAATRTVATAQ